MIKHTTSQAGWAWLGIFMMMTAYVASFDLWAHFSNHETMTGRMRDWLHDPVIGPFIFAFLVAVVAGLFYHFLFYASTHK